ncbi:MAG: hypothetical protein K2N80_04170, partial [Lachnospiraceae bacterium]|nr:hypothetical protein [Lachnospiraceae bacterium]
MRTFDKSVLTKKGNELLVEAASGREIEFTRLVTGCGNYDTHEELMNVIALREQRQEFCFTEIEKINEGSVLLKAVISNRNLKTGYYMTEVGIYGKVHGTEDEILYSINVNIDNADFLPPYNGLVPTEINISCYITIKQDERPRVTLGDAIDILINEIDEETKRAIKAEKNNSDAIVTETERAKEQESLKAPIESPEFLGRPTAPTPETNANNEQLATTAFVKAIVNALINGAPETLDTFKEIAEAFAENEILLNALNDAIGKKLGKTENAVSASKWETGRNINGIIMDGTSNRVNYGTCSTPAAAVIKTVECTGFYLVYGAEITVKFTMTNTAVNPKLNVGGTGAKQIYYRGVAIPAGYLAANRTYIFRYNGTQWELVGDVNTNITYSEMKGATADADGTHGLVPAAVAGKQTAFLRGDGTWVNLSTSLAGTVPGIPLDQTAGKALKDQLDKQNSNLSE